MKKQISLYLIVSPENSTPQWDWVDITHYIEQGFNINDSCDGTLDSGKLVFTLDDKDYIGGRFIKSEPLPPRTLIRIGEYDETDPSKKLQVQYIFMSSDTATSPIRTTQIDDKGNVSYIFSHEVNFVEATKDLEGKYPPNLSIRQPKNLYNRIFQRSTGWEFKTNPNTMYYTTGATRSFFAQSYINDKPDINNEQNVIQVENMTNGILRVNTIYNIEDSPIGGIGVEDYIFSVFLKARMTCPQVSNVRTLFGIDDYRFNYPARTVLDESDENGPTIDFLYDRVNIAMQMTAKYYNKTNGVIATNVQTKNIEYTGDSIIRDVDTESFNKPYIVYPKTIPAAVSTTSNSFIISKNLNAAYVTIEFKYTIEQLAMVCDNAGPGYGQSKNTAPRITQFSGSPFCQGVNPGNSGYQYWRMPYYIDALNVSVVSSAIQESQLDSYKTLYDIADKALQEINLKQRSKYTFSRRLTSILKNKRAPEMTLQDYNMREILVKVCRLVECLPVLGDADLLDDDENPITTISYVKPGEQYLELGIDGMEYTDFEKSNTLEEYFDNISTRMHNLISEDDYHTERVLIQAAEAEFAQITQENAGFVLTYPIYWLRQIKIFNLPILVRYTDSFGNTVAVTFYGNDPNFSPTNMVMQSWDFSDRTFEEDIYGALPDVNYQTPDARILGSLSKTNTLSYKSGSVFIKNIGHVGPAIPNYDPPFTAATTIVPNLAIIETATVLAYIQYGNSAAYPDFSIKDTNDTTIQNLYNVEAEVTYSALNEFTYRSITNQKRKLGLKTEHRVNAQDKVSSYEDTTYYLTAEQSKKGNIVTSPTIIYPNIMSCLRTGVRLMNNIVITTRKLKVFEEYVECSYELTENFILQSDDVKLDIEYERYSVPYDFVWREVLIFSHMILGYSINTLYQLYGNDVVDGEVSMLYNDMVFGLTPRENEAYLIVDMKYFVKPNGLPIQSDRKALVKLHLLSNDKNVSYIGKFVDNYSAGNQIFLQSQFNYAEPFRYCDSLGKVRKISFEMHQASRISFDRRLFPDASTAQINQGGSSLYVATLPNENTFQQGDDKDAREGYEFNITSSVESSTPDILFFSAKRHITHYTYLNNDPDTLDENTSFENLQTNTIYDVATYPIGTATLNPKVRSFYIRFPQTDLNVGKPVALWYYEEGLDTPILKYILKNYTTTIETNPQALPAGTYRSIILSSIITRYGQYATI